MFSYNCMSQGPCIPSFFYSAPMHAPWHVLPKNVRGCTICKNYRTDAFFSYFERLSMLLVVHASKTAFLCSKQCFVSHALADFCMWAWLVMSRILNTYWIVTSRTYMPGVCSDRAILLCLWTCSTPKFIAHLKEALRLLTLSTPKMKCCESSGLNTYWIVTSRTYAGCLPRSSDFVMSLDVLDTKVHSPDERSFKIA